MIITRGVGEKGRNLEDNVDKSSIVRGGVEEF